MLLTSIPLWNGYGYDDIKNLLYFAMYLSIFNQVLMTIHILE